LTADLFHLNVINIVIVLLVVVSATGVVDILATFGSWLDTDVVGWVGFLVELVGEVLGHDVATVFVILFENNLLALLAYGVHDLLEFKGH
jgi:hypothetical protein